MKYYRYLYKSDSIKNLDKLKLKLNLHRGLNDFYVIFWARGNNQLEIINAALLKQHYLQIKTLPVIGISKTYEEAVEIVVKITEDSLKYTKNADIKNFLLKRVETKDFTIDK